MLRHRPTEITLTVDDISKTTGRIAAKHRAFRGQARIRRGPERSRDDSVRISAHSLTIQSPLRAQISDSDSDGTKQEPRISLSTTRVVRQRNREIILERPSVSTESDDASSSTPRLPQLRVPSQSGIALPNPPSLGNRNQVSQLHLDGQSEQESGSNSTLHVPPVRTINLLSAPALSIDTNVNNNGSRQDNNRSQQDYARSPLYQSQVVSSPNMSSNGSQQDGNWPARARFTDGFIDYNQYSDSEYYIPRLQLTTYLHLNQFNNSM